MATIRPTFDATLNANQQNAFRRACQVWERFLQNDITINILARGIDFAATPGLGHLVGMCVPNFVQGNLSGQNITVTTAQGNALGVMGFVTRPAYDMVVFMQTGDNYNYAVNGVANGFPHFETVVLHEICHGLGFLGLCNIDVALIPNTGVFSDINLLAIAAPLQAQIPFWGALQRLQQGFPTKFARAFRETATRRIVTNGTPPAQVYPLFTTAGSMYIPIATTNCTVYTRGAFQPFTSCDHIDYAANCLMYETVDTNIIAIPDFRTKGILRVIGWNVA